MANKRPDAREIIGDLDRIVAPNGIQETYRAPIGGIDQWIYARGQDRGNPVILFVHGGPASPLSPLMWAYQRPLEEFFTVVTWDQRGAGRTHLDVDPDTIADTIRIDQYVSDTLEVAAWVRGRYDKGKLVLMGHSWGTILGMKAALARPDLFSAYVGIGQVINARDNERISFDYALSQARKHENTTAISELESIAPYPGDTALTRKRIVVARKWAQHYGGLSAYRHESMYFFQAPYLSLEYDDRAVSAIDQGNRFTLRRVLPEFLDVDFKPVTSFPIPIFMFMGRHDYTTPSEPTASWLSALDAPAKKAIWFENSAHLIPFEEPGKLLLSLAQHILPLARDDAGND